MSAVIQKPSDQDRNPQKTPDYDTDTTRRDYTPGPRQAIPEIPLVAPHPNDPKQGAGMKKIPFHALPFAVIAELAVAHGEGALKYGRHNWREGEVVVSTYYAAALRHIFSFIEGEDIDPESGLSHVTKAIASLCVLRDAQINGCAEDDRPAPIPEDFMAGLNAATCEMNARVAAFLEDQKT